MKPPGWLVMAPKSEWTRSPDGKHINVGIRVRRCSLDLAGLTVAETPAERAQLLAEIRRLCPECRRVNGTCAHHSRPERGTPPRKE